MTAPRPARKSRDIDTFLGRQANIRSQRRFLEMWNRREFHAGRSLRRLVVGPLGDVKWFLADGGKTVPYSDLGKADG